MCARLYVVLHQSARHVSYKSQSSLYKQGQHNICHVRPGKCYISDVRTLISDVRTVPQTLFNAQIDSKALKGRACFPSFLGGQYPI